MPSSLSRRGVPFCMYAYKGESRICRHTNNTRLSLALAWFMVWTDVEKARIEHNTALYLGWMQKSEEQVRMSSQSSMFSDLKESHAQFFFQTNLHEMCHFKRIWSERMRPKLSLQMWTYSCANRKIVSSAKNKSTLKWSSKMRVVMSLLVTHIFTVLWHFSKMSSECKWMLEYKSSASMSWVMSSVLVSVVSSVWGLISSTDKAED